MIISIQTLKKTAVAVIASVMLFVAFAPQTHAAQTYYPTYRAQSAQEMVAYLQVLIAQLEALQREYKSQYGNGPVTQVRGIYTNNSNRYDVEVDTRSVRNIDEEEATFEAEIDFDDAPYAFVWFEYGQNGRLTESTDDLKMFEDDSQYFHVDIDGLDEDEKYYVRAVAEDPSGNRVYGDIVSFVTDGNGGSSNDDDDDDDDYNSNDDEPEVETQDVRNITDDSARLYGEIDMNDFEDGLVFFVYGEDEDAIEEVEDEDTFRDIDTDGDDIQKYKVYDNHEGSRTFWIEVYGLNDETDHYYRICVEFEDEDGDDMLMCGDVESFETDN